MICGLDIEARGMSMDSDDIRSIQIFNPEKNRTTFFDIGLNPVVSKDHKVEYYFVDMATEVVSSGGVTNMADVITILGKHQYVTHRGYYEHYMFKRCFGANVEIVGDSWILSNLIPTGDYTHSLNDIIRRYLNPDYAKDRYGSWEDFYNQGLWDRPGMTENQILYGSRDCHCYNVVKHLTENPAYKKYANLAYKIEVAMIPVFTSMRLNGITVDLEVLRLRLAEHKGDLSTVMARIKDLAGREINVNSTKDVQTLLFEERRNMPLKRTKTGAPSVDAEVLESLQDPVASLIVEAKTLSTNISKMNTIAYGPKKKEEKRAGTLSDDGKLLFINPEFKPFSESGGSGRMTSDPGLTSWPWGVRESVVPSKRGNKFYFADISQAEYMIVAYYAGEQSAINAYKSGADIHRATASTVFGIPYDQVTAELREKTKQLVYAMLYGSEGASIAEHGNMSMSEARELLEKFYVAHPNITKLRESVHQFASETGTTKTPFGRHRYLGEPLFAGEEDPRMMRKAFNTFSQTGCADILKLAMIKMFRSLPVGCTMVYTVYDSLLVEFPPDLLLPKEVLDKCLCEALTITMFGQAWSFRFESGIGSNWYEAKRNSKCS